MNGGAHSSRISLALAVALMSLLASPGEAVVVSTTTGNTAAPADDFGFANVGAKAGATGVYLGYRWVLTAAHVSASDIVLNGRTYSYQTGTDIQLKNPTGYDLTEYTDLRLFRITEDPWLPTLRIASSYLDVWADVVMVGNGRNRQDELKGWNVTGPYHEGDPWTWTPVTPPESGNAQGYLMNIDQVVRWGTNRVEPGMYAFDVNDLDFVGFRTDFDQYGATEHEAQAAAGDSGGGVFHKSGDHWELAGLMHAISTFHNAPSTAIFGAETHCSDLVVYRDQILSIITPLGGDANLDGRVDAADASIMAANWGRSAGVLWGHGDFNEDGVINAEDAAILADNFGTNAAAEQESGAQPALPEPSAIGLVFMGLAGILAGRLRRG